MTRTMKAGKTVREACEVDHLISREFGGANGNANDGRIAQRKTALGLAGRALPVRAGMRHNAF